MENLLRCFVARGFIFCLLMSLSGLAVGARDTSLAHWIEVSLENNPGVRAAYHQWQSKTAIRQSSGALPDPTLNFDYFIDEIQTRTGPQESRITISQKLPWFGKRRLETDIADTMADGARFRLLETKHTLTHQLTQLWADGIYLERDLAITKENLSLLEQIERIARTKYRLAMAQHPDLIRIQLQRSKTENRLSALNRERLDLVAQLGQLSHQNVAPDFRWPDQFPTLNELATEQQLLESARKNSPMLARFKTQTDARLQKAKASELRNRPDFTLKYGRMFTGEAVNPDIDGSGDDPQFVGVGINIPLWFEKNRSLVNAAHQSRIEAEHALRGAHRALQSALAQALHRFRDAETQLQRFQYALIPQAENALTTLLKSYQTGSSDFSDLLETEKLLLSLKQEQAKLRRERWKAYASIRQLTADYPLQP